MEDKETCDFIQEAKVAIAKQNFIDYEDKLNKIKEFKKAILDIDFEDQYTIAIKLTAIFDLKAPAVEKSTATPYYNIGLLSISQPRGFEIKNCGQFKCDGVLGCKMFLLFHSEI